MVGTAQGRLCPPYRFCPGRALQDEVAHADSFDKYPYMYILLYIPEENPAMAHVSYSELRNNLASYMEEVCDDRAPLVVTRQNARSVVIMSEQDYEGLMETVHLLKSPANAARLLRSIKDADRGKSKKREIVEPGKAGARRK
jgi:antitoxin YefM